MYMTIDKSCGVSAKREPGSHRSIKKIHKVSGQDCNEAVLLIIILVSSLKSFCLLFSPV
jgi:hypothetical protein